MKGIIDRFEGKYAVVECDDGILRNVHRSKIPKGAAEGDALIIDTEIIIDYDETKRRKEKIEKLSEGMWE